VDGIKTIVEQADALVICSADVPTGQALAREYGCAFYEDYLDMMDTEHPDFVSVCVPTYMHPDVVRAAIDRGIPVLCEKPFTLEAADALALQRLAAQKQVPLMIGHCLRFSRPYVYLKNCIADGRFGKLQSLRLHRNSARPGWSVDNWFANLARSGGIIRDLHIHDTDMVISLLGVPEAVYTRGNDSCCTTVFSYPENLVVVGEASWRNTPGFPFCAGFDAVFEKACVVCQNDSVTLHLGQQQLSPLEEEAFPAAIASADMMTNELRYFCHCLRTGSYPALCDPAETVKTMYVSCAQSESARLGHPVSLRPPEIG